MTERPIFPLVIVTDFVDQALLQALSAIFDLLVQMADTLDAIERGQ